MSEQRQAADAAAAAAAAAEAAAAAAEAAADEAAANVAAADEAAAVDAVADEVAADEADAEADDDDLVAHVVVSTTTNAIFRERHMDGFKQDLTAVEKDVSDIYTVVQDLTRQFSLVYTSPAEQRNRLIRTIGYSMWCVNRTTTRLVLFLKEMENYLAVGLADADDLDEDDPVLRARKVEHLAMAMRLASVMVAYGRAVVQYSDGPDETRTLTELIHNYDKLVLMTMHYRQFDGSGYGRYDGDPYTVDEEYRPQLADAQAAVALAEVNCRRLIVDECMTEMVTLMGRHEFVYRREGLLKKWKTRVSTARRYMMNWMREL